MIYFKQAECYYSFSLESGRSRITQRNLSVSLRLMANLVFQVENIILTAETK